MNVNIEIFIDKDRKDSQPEPLALYEIENDTMHIDKGVIVIAKVNSKDIELQSSDYSEFRFISLEEVNEYSLEAVNDFEDTIKKGFKKMEELKWKI